MADSQTKTVPVSAEPTLHLKLQVDAEPELSSVPSFRYRNVRLDPERALEPARKKLTTLEAQRVMNVFDETIRRVQIVTLLPYIIQNLDRFSVSLGSELVELLKHHSVVISSYDEIRRELNIQLGRRATMISEEETRKAEEETRKAEEETRKAEEKKRKAEEEVVKSGTNEEPAEGMEGDEPADATEGPDSPHEGSVQSLTPKMEDEETAESMEEDKPADSTEEANSPHEGSVLSLNQTVENEEPADRKEGEEPADDTEGAGSVHEGSVQDEPLAAAHCTESLLQAAIRNLSLVAEQMSHSTRNILRAFTINPAVMAALIDQMNEREPQCQTLIQYLQELKMILMNRLLTTPEEERERMSYLTEVSKRERQNAVVIEKLEQELEMKLDDKDHEIQKRNDLIKRLQGELHQVEKLTEEHIRRLRADAEKQEAADEKTSEGKQHKLQSDLVQLRTRLQNAITVHRASEQELRNKKFKIETEVENWIIKYDQELGERQDEYEEIDAIYIVEKKQLRELEQRFSSLEKEYMAILGGRRLAREEREKAERVVAYKMRAATTIQAVWRCYKVRKALMHRRKKKAKSDKPKKGKKGKKGKK